MRRLLLEVDLVQHGGPYVGGDGGDRAARERRIDELGRLRCDVQKRQIGFQRVRHAGFLHFDNHARPGRRQHGSVDLGDGG